MPNIIEQKPLYVLMPVRQPIIFTISNATIVATYSNVKFIAEIYISHTTVPNMSSTADLVGKFKTTPNNVGVGIFDISSVIENYVKADNLAIAGTKYKGYNTSSTAQNAPIHIIDKWSSNTKSLAWLTIKFKIEGSATPTDAPEVINSETTQTSENYEIFNGYLKHTDRLLTYNGNFGWSNVTLIPSSSSYSKFMTNAPTTQYANMEDYGTFAFNNNPDWGVQVNSIGFSFYTSADGYISSQTITTWINPAVMGLSKYRLLYAGVFPGNLQNWTTIPANAAYYRVAAYSSSSVQITKTYTIHINCPTLKGYEPIRLAWLNQWGAWDYYTFNKKSVRSISSKGSTYTQLEGTWNESYLRINGYKGGKKSFRVNATEKIKMNTNFVTEEEGEWFEELINSPEIYILEGFQTDPNGILEMLNTYVTPVRLTTSSYTRKTVANDKLMQYTLEVEKGKILRTQSI